MAPAFTAPVRVLRAGGCSFGVRGPSRASALRHGRQGPGRDVLPGDHGLVHPRRAPHHLPVRVFFIYDLRGGKGVPTTPLLTDSPGGGKGVHFPFSKDHNHFFKNRSPTSYPPPPAGRDPPIPPGRKTKKNTHTTKLCSPSTGTTSPATTLTSARGRTCSSGGGGGHWPP